jgi:putative oxidoreductase
MTNPAAALRSFVQFAVRVVALVECWLTPLFDLAIRLYVASVFLRSGWIKLSDWSSTLALFRSEYQVPLLPPEIAAVMGAGGELILPVFLALGLAGRFGAAGLSVVNVVAVISYADLSDLGRQDHLLWGVLLLVTLLHGPGRLSLDHWLRRRWLP